MRKKVRPTLLQRCVMSVARFYAGISMAAKYDYHIRARKIDEPFILVANHATEYDYFLAGLSVKNYMYFVCSEHLMRQGLLSRFLKTAVNPVPLSKGHISATAMLEIVRRIRDGNNICLFPEGSRTFDGNTNPISPAVGALLKRAGCAVVTYHMEGAFFTAPRWTKIWRKGPIRGHICRVIPSSDIRQMSAQEIYDVVCGDLQENAYARQLQNPVRYTGRQLASGLENYLFVCPVCHAFDSLKSEGNRIRCDGCGSSSVYDEYGFLTGNFPYKTLPEWNEFDEKELFSLEKKDFLVESAHLDRIMPEHRNVFVKEGPLSITDRKLSLGDMVFPYEDITAMEYINCGNTLLFTHDGIYYEMKAAYLGGVKIRLLWAEVRREKEKNDGHKG